MRREGGDNEFNHSDKGGWKLIWEIGLQMKLKRQTIACTSCVSFINFNAKPRLQDIVTVYYTLHRWNWFFCLWYYQRWSILLLLIQTFLVVCTTYLAFPVQNKCHCKTLHNSHCPCFWGLSLYKNPPLKPFLHILISRSDSAVQMCQTSRFLHITQYTCCLSYLCKHTRQASVSLKIKLENPIFLIKCSYMLKL